MKPHTVMGLFLYEGYRKLGLKRIKSADLASQFRRDFRPIVKKRPGQYMCKRYVVKNINMSILHSIRNLC